MCAGAASPAPLLLKDVLVPHTPSSLKTVTLDNGLTIFLREKRDAPVASFWVWYRVGSRNELPGRTGLSHWVEHMQFKGTPSTPKGAIFGDVSRVGGNLNAMTSMDWTAYFETVPASELDLSLRIESDRMINSLFDPHETESERTVILSERQGAENRPTYHLYEEVLGTAFQAHPYGHMVIGYEQDLKQISRDDLYNHYRRFYRPNNAYITAVGDFDADELTARIEASFGAIPANDEPLPPVARDAPQRGERRVTIQKPSPAAYLMMGYKMPDARHEDIPAILVADALLSGAKTMGMGGGGGMGRSSRLYRALVSKGLARSASSSAGLNHDQHLWSFSATALPGVAPEDIETAIDAEIERLKTELADEEEFVKARKQSRAQYVYSQETATSQAYWLGQMEIVDHAARVDTLADELARVTPEDVQRAVRTWLVPDQRTIGWQLPDDNAVAAGADVPELTSVESNAPSTFHTWGYTGADVSQYGFVSPARASRRSMERSPSARATPRQARQRPAWPRSPAGC
jgi:zinc protease